ncbi:NarL family two-component system sensor histidine kinase YdfH [Virgibacillus natechei]|uniref:histidine kinase n=1 Tax=Virgibacillus natechei TaxID=1216297 RepID=A0ABS4IEB5_9BACI|nr:sensor histidine kinase [Virgibacillus natechei]MBP1969269.1 NarL family two-component system sensor histidine kinase YdfH [Virgibacillus natechei]UZD12426.1 sensor histidine kinase [Virgibacillus natechei]
MDYDKLFLFDDQPKTLNVYRVRLLFWILLVTVATLLLQSIGEVLFVLSSIFLILMVLHILLYRLSNSSKRKYSWYYFFTQSCIIFISAFLLPHGSPIVLVGLLPILISESIHLFKSSFKVFSAVIILYIFYTVAIVVNYGAHELRIFIPILFFIVAIAVFYSILHVKEINAWRRMQYYINQLENANQKIEELTIRNERKRLARDLHDTMAQGLAGLIMKLEAIDVYIGQGNNEKSKQILLESMKQARTTLKDAREAIDDLRSKSLSEQTFVQEAEKEISKFKEATSIKVNNSIEAIPPLADLLKKHGIYIIRECLTNIAKHAHANLVQLNIYATNDDLCIRIYDNGVGFDADYIGETSGHYGLLGIYERVRILGGVVNVDSNQKFGTTIKIVIPLNQKGDCDEY